MSDKKLAVLGIIAVLLAGAAILQSRLGQEDHTADFSSSALIEGLDISAVKTIEVFSEQGDTPVNLAREEARFVVADKANYPADAGKINRLINQCLDIRTVESITDNPENHADLQVTEDTARYVIAFKNADDQPIVTVLLSPPDPDTGGGYARLQSQAAVYRIQNAPWVNTQPIDYIDTELLAMEPDKISSVAVKTPDSSYVLASPPDSDTITLEKMPAGKQFKETAYRTVFNALQSLRFDDVLTPADLPESVTLDSRYLCKLYDLTVYNVSIGQNEDETYVKVAADYLDKTPVEKTMGEVETDEELKKKEAKLLAIDAVKEFNARHEDWIYRIPSDKAEQLVKPLSELLENVSEPADPNDTAPSMLDPAAEE